MDWKQIAEQMKFNENKSWAEVADAIMIYFPTLDKQRVLEKARSYLRKTDRYKAKPQDITETARKMLLKGTNIEQLKKTLGTSEKVTEAVIDDLMTEGYNIVRNGDFIVISNIIVPTENIVKEKWNGDKIIRFGLMGDTQINSKYTQLTHLHSLYDIYLSEGIETVYHVGDIDEGEQMRVGHQYECYTQGADDHIAEIVRVYPARRGIKTKFITGNHDHSIIKRAGYDIGYSIANMRQDMEYLGQSCALVYLTDNCTMELRHPIDGTAYALSYKIQKMIEAMSGGEKPNILAVGHYHKADYIFYRNVHAIQTGTLQAQTPFMRGKGISAHMGGWIVEIHVNDDGAINRIKTEFIPFYTAIKDDYKNWAQ